MSDYIPKEQALKVVACAANHLCPYHPRPIDTDTQVYRCIICNFRAHGTECSDGKFLEEHLEFSFIHCKMCTAQDLQMQAEAQRVVHCSRKGCKVTGDFARLPCHYNGRSSHGTKFLHVECYQKLVLDLSFILYCPHS